MVRAAETRFSAAQTLWEECKAEWKKDTKYERINIPDRIDNMVEKAFLTQLKKFC